MVRVITIDGTEYSVYEPETQLVWDTVNGYLLEVRISGYCNDGYKRTFRRTLEWNAEGYLIKVSPWEIVE